MNQRQRMTAETCLAGATSNVMDFPEIVAALIDAGFESYEVDFRRSEAVYFLPSGESIILPIHRDDNDIAAGFDAAAIRAAIGEAQANAPGYTYAGFCAKVKQAGCVSYIVSFPGRRALYLGRTAEAHVEMFPGAD